MRFDLVTIFPGYFAPLELSLLGKAQDEGTVETHVHDLRQWAEGKHLSVDDTPTGGGAGMVMRADVWGRALDQILDDASTDDVVLAIPTPSGEPLTQRTLEQLAGAQQIVVACGRYEGIDARVADHYRKQPGVRVLEFSLGDYVLNGGEVAALALVEGVGRLVEGVVGNADSLVEESHSEAGLLEYPVYTRPRQWRDQDTPHVLLSGDHARIARWRRDQALRRTARRRPDMLERLLAEDAVSRPGGEKPLDEHAPGRPASATPAPTPAPGTGGQPAGALESTLAERRVLDHRDLEVLAAEGVLIRPSRASVRYQVAGAEDLPAVAALAQRTFPMACPPGTPQEEVDQFIAASLTEDALAQKLSEGARILTATVDREPIAYTLMQPQPDAGALDPTPVPEGAAYLSKCYTDAQWQGSGVSGALLEAAIEDAAGAWGATAVVLGTNKGNKRAAKFYRRHGFRRAGTRTFQVGRTRHRDDVFVRDLTANALT